MLTPYCIYCKTENPNEFHNREHGVPQAFGKFDSETPTLKCVCDICNKYFGKTLDQNLARETLEGVARYRNKKFSRENRRQRKLRITLDDSHEAGGFKGVVIDGIDPTTGNLNTIRPQLHVTNRTTGINEVYFSEDIDALVLPDDAYGQVGRRHWKVFAASKQDHDDFVEMLRRAGHHFRPDERILPAPKPSKDDNTLPVVLQGEVDNLHKRGLAKIIVNCAASEWGADQFRKPMWQALLRFIRFGRGELGVRQASKPFWGDESNDWRFPGDSISLRVENTARGVVGAIQFYTADTYELLLLPALSVDTQLEFAIRFTPGKKPVRGEKRSVTPMGT